MTYQEAIGLLATMLALPDQVAPGVAPTAVGGGGSATKAAILALAQGAGLDTTSFIDGDPAERFLEIAARAMVAWGRVPTAAVRALFFALSTDPGDVDDYGTPDQSPDQTPRPGMLSAVGQGFFNCVRGGQTFASSFVVLKNNGTTTATFAPGSLTLEASTLVQRDGGTPTYTNVADPALYPGGTLTLAPGATSPPLPLQALQIGSYGTAAANKIDTCVTQTFGALVVISSTTAYGQDRELRSNYIGRCLLAADRLSPGGPAAAYAFACTTQVDPTTGELVPLQRFDGSGATKITQSYVSPASATAQITVYVGGAVGPVDDIDVSSATANIIGITLADASGNIWNPAPLGVLPDTVSLLPTPDDPNITPHPTPGCANCTATPINITYSCRIRASSVSGGAPLGTYGTSGGGPPPATIAAVFSAIASALSTYLLSTGIGGLDQTAGSGFVFTADLPGIIRGTQAGIYDPIVSAPSAATTAIGIGCIATLGTVTGTIVVTA